MAPSSEEAPNIIELSNREATRLINFIKSNTKQDNSDHLLAKGIEKRIQDGNPNWEESQALKQVFNTILTNSWENAPKFETNYEPFVP
ncbi:hypothetical protein DSO57_1022259 [Entomophthora muscae]|uniref:Uncharacterized protein n=1 Tax=Entomophthora muscae TaxID=34485 RepID=A0ACC2RHU9_9FUNG|nr:hypothetical protein DSO57_1022259 [Entomophthora muscae]